MKFYKCNHCQNLIEMVDDRKVNPVCCGEKMMELVPGKVDASLEKHVPVVEVKDGVVEVMVGSVAHPMTEEHLIEWIVVETDKGVYRKNLKAGESTPINYTVNKKLIEWDIDRNKNNFNYDNFCNISSIDS